ncbi:MAG: hypothetical protein ACYCU8_12745 [Ferrimicrobium acidiphilum]
MQPKQKLVLSMSPEPSRPFPVRRGLIGFLLSSLPVREVELAGLAIFAAAVANAVFFVTHAPVVAILFGLIGGILGLGAISDLRTGKIPKELMAVGALCAVALQVSVNGWIDGAIRIGCITGVWLVFASLRHARSGIGGGDLTMIGVTWLTLGVFPVFAGLVALMGWAMSLVIILSVLQFLHVRHFKAGPMFAIAAIFSWIIAFLCIF